MVRYCKRTGCGHEESEHTSAGCAAMVPGANVMLHCECREFVAVENVRACTCDHPASVHDHKVGCTADGCPCCWLGQHAKPPSVPPLRVVSGGLSPELQHKVDSFMLEEEARARRIDDPKGTGPLLETLAEPPRERLQRQTIIEPGALIMVAGKSREMTELHAAANAIVAETNCEDLAAGAFLMRATIRGQAQEIVRLRAELENRDRILNQLGDRKLATSINVQIKVDGDTDPDRVAKALREGLEQFQRGPTTVA